MGLLKDKDKEQLTKAFEQHLQKPVKMIFFTQEMECDFCANTHELLEELTELSDMLALEVYDFVNDKDKADELGIDKIPGLAILGDGDVDYGIRFYGIPAGYEFAALIEDIVDISRGGTVLPEPVMEALATIDKPVHLQVMVSPTCPYCPRSVRVAHKLAIANKHIRGDMVEMTEFPMMAQRYDIQSVPNTVINDGAVLVGALPELNVVQEIQKALKEQVIN